VITVMTIDTRTSVVRETTRIMIGVNVLPTTEVEHVDSLFKFNSIIICCFLEKRHADCACDLAGSCVCVKLL